VDQATGTVAPAAGFRGEAVGDPERHALWRVRIPVLEPARGTELYVRPSLDGRGTVDGRLTLTAGEIATFDTYFNAFGVGKWVRHTTVRRVSVAVGTRGPIRLEVVHDGVGRWPAVVAGGEFDSPGLQDHELVLPPLDDLGDGSLFVRATCLGERATIAEGAWYTADRPAREARLGVVITTFNRPDEVRASVRGLADAVRRDPALADRLDVVVVDNGRNLDLGGTGDLSVTVLPNPNVGGSGGFARGLMHLRDAGRATHALFMDDDVTFDPEIVERTLQLVSYASDPNLCVAGAMLDRSEPTKLFEAGAQFVGTSINPNRAPGQGLDLEDRHDLLVAEEERDPIDYGAWWFFAFPIALTRDNPLPTFVRGDDVCWGLLHAGSHTATFNGIGLWHEGFEHKNGPLAWFYETRNFALASMLAEPGYRWWHLLARYVDLCGRSLVSLKYASASNITSGMREFLRGPEHWLAVDQTALHAQVGAFEGERVEPLTEDLERVAELPVRHGLSRYTAALASVALLGGHLLPEAFDRRPLRAVPIQQRLLGAAPGRGAILYRDSTRRYGFVARRDRRRFFTLFGEMVRTAARIPVSFGQLRRDYHASYPEMVSDAYWRRQFGRAR